MTVAASVVLWGWTLWATHQDPIEVETPRRNKLIRSPATPRTREAFKKRPCTCKLVTVRDDCRQNKQNNKWTCSDEEEAETDTNIIPTTMKQKQQMILNR